MPESDSTLRRLAEAYGIHTTWVDARGEAKTVGVHTLRALLAALGVEAASPDLAARSLRAHASRAWRHALPRMLTAEAGGQAVADLGIPSASVHRPIRWLVTTPSGARRTGTAMPGVVAVDAVSRRSRCQLAIPLPAEVGYGRIALDDGALGEAELALAPPTCAGMSEGRRDWGLVAQVYSLREATDGGSGHYGALARLATAAGQHGAQSLAISPVHALFAADPGHVSPYSPSSRRHLNGLLVDPTLVPGLEGSMAAILEGCGPGDLKSLDLIDYAACLTLRARQLRALFDAFARQHLTSTPTSLGTEFLEFRRVGGTPLEDHARFEMLHALFYGRDPGAWDWSSWPVTCRDPRHRDVARLARDHHDDVTFHAFLQWLADRQLGAAQGAARAAGMSIGLIADLAVGLHQGGSQAWSEPQSLLRGASIGAPPDLFNTRGQDWGLTTFSPSSLADGGYGDFRADLQRAMRHAGGVRIDHIMGLARVWCIPSGHPPSEGAYLSMPFDDLARLIAIESQRARCMVIGEDLGTVPEGFRQQLEHRKISGIRVLYFEREADGRFAAPDRYGGSAIATPSTHDLPTIRGWWEGRDIDWRLTVGPVVASSEESWLRDERRRDRDQLWAALRNEHLVVGDVPPATFDDRLAQAIVAFLGRTASPLVLLPLEDVLLLPEQPNLPGTTVQHPNWRRRLPLDAHRLKAPTASAIMSSLARSRG